MKDSIELVFMCFGIGMMALLGFTGILLMLCFPVVAVISVLYAFKVFFF